MRLKFYLIISILFLSLSLFPQKGKNGAGNISAANTKVNEFTSLGSNAPAGTATINVTASGLNVNSRFSSSLAPGDLIMIIQMQGALIKLIPTPVWAPDSTYGNVYNYGNCGNYEFAEVKSVISGTQIEINCGLTYAYSSAGKTQVVRVPRYSSLNVAATGTLTTDPWNGTTGGVLAVEVDGNTTINSGGVISANGLGFRGGVAVANSGSANGNFATKNPNDGAEKGEGIGSDRLINSAATDDTLGKQCKGAPANGGGGGNANNCGGGGGGNAGNLSIYYGLGVPNTTYSTAFNLEYAGRASIVSSGGGKGGYGTSTVNGNPTTHSPNNSFWGSFERPKYGGFGGRPLDYSTGKIYMGGGGGSGHMSPSQSNGTSACSGGAGGGIIYILNYGTVSGTGTISANGANGVNSFGNPTFSNPTQGIDGAGGAGAGGTIILKSNGTIASITANANGGTGGNQVISGAASNEGQGPGGGGGGGYIAANGSTFTQNVNGGTNGVTNAVAFATAFPMNGATSGNSGLNNQTIPVYTFTTASAGQTLCANQSTTLSASSTDPSATIQWYNSATGGSVASTGTVYTTPVYTAAGTYTVYAGSCPGIYRLPIIITVNSGLNISINSPTVCSGQSAVLTPSSSATSYTWSTSQTTTTISVSPSSTTIYTVTGANATCSGTQTTAVTVSSNVNISIPAATVCPGASTILTASGATSYTWNTGAHTNTLSVSPLATTVYSVNGTSGSCTGSQTVAVTVGSNLVVSVASATICQGTNAVLTASGASTYTWNTGANTNTLSVSPASTTVYSVTGNTGFCSASQTATVTVSSNIVINVPSATICVGASTVLTASGATSYTWNTGANTNTISVTPFTTTVYSVTGNNGTCSGIGTATVSISPGPSIIATANPASICTGQSTTLSASGANTYTWSNSFNGSSQTVSPGSTTTYSVIGTNSSGCLGFPGTITISVTPIPTVSATSATICAGQAAALTASGTTSYTWSTGETTSSINPSPNTTATYTVSGSNGGCAASFVTTVIVNSSPSLSVIPDITSGCSSLCVNFTNITSPSSAAVSYNFGDGNTAAINNPSHCYTALGSYTVSANTTDPVTGCSATYILPVAITVTSKPVALFSIQEGTLVTEGSAIHLINNSTNATGYIWELCNSSSYITTDVTTQASDTGKCCIKLIAKAGAGCRDSVTTCIEVTNEASISVPNVFTPNNDTRNDVFKIKTSGIKSLSCAIFDRWGLKLYEWDGINGSWDGKTKAGAPAVDGSYFYIINYTDLKDVSKTEKGSLSLFRN